MGDRDRTGSPNWPDSADLTSGRVLFLPEPGACGGRLDPGQVLVPDWLAKQLDWHVWPSLSPWAASTRARVVCHHIDWEQVQEAEPVLFERRQQLGVPPLDLLWEAKRDLSALGYRLCFDMEVQSVEGKLALVVHGAGVLGWLTDRAWEAAAGSLTTCATVLREPRRDIANAGWIRPARPPVSVGKRPLAPGIRMPAGAWLLGDWVHTWWSYLDGPLSAGCRCPAHDSEAAFGPRGGG